LGQHRNVVKRFFQWVLSSVFSDRTIEFILGKTKSLKAADNLVQKFEAPVPAPTRTIERSTPVSNVPIPTRVIERTITPGKMPVIKYKAQPEEPISNSDARRTLRRLPCNRRPSAVLPKTNNTQPSAPPAERAYADACAISSMSAMQQWGMVCNAGKVMRQQPTIDGRPPAYNPAAMRYGS
jgi:hypothetical protein